MKAMILAAGLGTRLRPLTNDRPKALVELHGRTLLEITLSRLRTFGVTEAVINVHHFADMVVAYLKTKNNFNMRIEISREDDQLLDTGGGLKKAAWFFRQDSAHAQSGPNNSGSNNDPFVLHNVDVISTIDLNTMLQLHKESRAIATLAVQSRDSSRQLLFNDQLQLSGRRIAYQDTVIPNEARNLLVRPLQPLAFSGIHILSTRLLPQITETGAFSIMDTYLRLAAQGERIQAFRADKYYWRDLGKPSDLSQAAVDLQQNVLPS